MSSSGTPTFAVTQDTLINDAFRKLRILAVGQTIDASQRSEAVLRLNMVLAELSSRGLPLWTYGVLLVPMVANQLVYTIGPDASADVNTVRPLRVLDGCFIRQNYGNTAVDTPLRLISRLEYLQYGDKLATGIPNSIYYDSKIVDPNDPAKTSPSAPLASLFVYTTLEPGQTRTVFLNTQRPIFAMTDIAQEYDVPQEWYMAVMYGLAAELADDYEVPEDRITRLESRRDQKIEKMLDWSVETASTTFGAQVFNQR